MADEVEIRQQATAESPEGSSLPLGASQQLEEAFDIEAVPEDEFEGDLEEGFDDGLDEEDEDIEEAEPGAPQGEFAEALFAPTRFAQRPLTAGLEQGPGSPDTPMPNEGHRAFLRRMAERMEASPTASDEVRVWAERVRQGA